MAAVVSDVVTRALRMVGVLGSGDSPTSDELQDGVDTYNSLQRSLFGNDIGQKLVSSVVSAATQSGENGRVYQCGSVTTTITLPAAPRDGNRIGVADAQVNFSGHPVTINPNGQLIEGSASNLVLNTNSDNRTWFFRGDTGSWVREADQLAADTPYFPPDVTEALVFLLAVRLGTEYGTAAMVTDQVLELADQGRQVIARRYARRARIQIDPARSAMPTSNQTVRGI